MDNTGRPSPQRQQRTNYVVSENPFFWKHRLDRLYFYSAYDLYTQTIERGEKATKKQKKDRQQSSELCRRFKQTLSRRDVTVHFVGSWSVHLFLSYRIALIWRNILGILYRRLELSRVPAYPRPLMAWGTYVPFDTRLPSMSYESNSFLNTRTAVRDPPNLWIQISLTTLCVLRGT